MSHKITIQPDGISFDLKSSQTILEGAIAAGITIPYGCRNGACGSCKAKILSGSVLCDEFQQSAMTDEEKQNGWTLCCQAYATEDVTIEARVSNIDSKIPQPKITPVRVEALARLNHDVMRMLLKLPGDEKLNFIAGQYIEFIMADGSRRAFSIASPPHAPLIELHLRLIDGGKFTHYVFEEMQEKSIHRIEGPIGQFFLRDSEKPIIFVSGGTGFAPIKSVIEDMFEKGNERTIYLYQGVRQLEDLYMDELCRSWRQKYVNFNYIPVFSELEKEAENLRTGFVHQAVLDDFDSIVDYQVYCCGAPILVETTFNDFVKNGLPEDEFFADAFSFAPPKPTP
jgi:CDP-4-dehydro-6-deoxyglucose reductase